jgi:hypothetical protein
LQVKSLLAQPCAHGPRGCGRPLPAAGRVRMCNH